MTQSKRFKAEDRVVFTYGPGELQPNTREVMTVLEVTDDGRGEVKVHVQFGDGECRSYGPDQLELAAS